MSRASPICREACRPCRTPTARLRTCRLGRLRDARADRRGRTAGPGDRAGAPLVRDVEAAGGVLASDDLARYRAAERAHADRPPARPSPRRAASPPGRPSRMRWRCCAARSAAGLAPQRTPGPRRCSSPTGAARDHGRRRRPSRSACTTHLCVVDRAGTMVSLTQTLLSVFGSKVVSPSTGILLNNGIMWFDPRPGARTPWRRASGRCPTCAR